jgi:hypothetical protein
LNKKTNKIKPLILTFLLVLSSINLFISNNAVAEDDYPPLELNVAIYYPNMCGPTLLIYTSARGGNPNYNFYISYGDYHYEQIYDTTETIFEHTYPEWLMDYWIITMGVKVVDSDGNTVVKDSKIRLYSCDDPPLPPPNPDNDTYPPELIWNPTSIDFGCMLEGQTRDEILTVTNNGTGDIEYNFMWDSDWISVFPWNGSVPNQFIENVHFITVNTTGFSLGEHNGFVYINNTPIPVSVTIVDHLPEPILSLNSNSCDLGTLYKGQVATASFDLWNSGEGRLEYGFNASDESISIYETSMRAGSSIGEHHTIFAEVDTKNLSVGSHSIELLVNSNGGNETFYLNFDVYSEADFLNITKPEPGAIYLYGVKLFNLPFLYDFSLIFGSISIEVDDSGFNFSSVEFYLDNELVNTSYEKPYNFKIDEKIFGLHKILVKGYDFEDYLVDTCEKEFLIYNL